MSNKPSTRADTLEILHDVAKSRGVGGAMLTTLEHIISAESGGDRYAASLNSKARGCFQVIPSTWLGQIKKDGQEIGLGHYSKHIRWDESNKRWTIDDPSMLKTVLDLRYDVKASCEVAIALTKDNKRAIGKALGREVTAGELYLGHFLGERDALKVLQHPDPNAKITTFLSTDVIDANSDNLIKKTKGVSLLTNGQRIGLRDFTVADIQQWAATKMEQELSYEQLSEQNRQASWRRRHPRQAPSGKPDDYSDRVEAQGDMTMVEAIIQFVVQLSKGIMTAIGGMLGISDDAPTSPPQTPSSSRVAAVGNAPSRPRA